MNHNLDNVRRAAAFDERRRQAGELERHDFNGAKACLVGCRDDGLTKAETKMVISTIADVTEIEASVLRELNTEVLCEHPEHGALVSIAQTAAALKAEVTARYGEPVFSEGALWAYADETKHDEEGAWKVVSDEEVDRVQIDCFPTEVTAKSSFRREVTKRFYSDVNAPDAFESSPSGIALMNGFLSYDEASGSVELKAHASDNRARNKLAVNYIPDAQAPNFVRLLMRAFGDDAVQMSVFLEWLACAIFQKMPADDPVRTCLVLYGNQRTGKSTLIRFAGVFFLDSMVASLSPELLGKLEHNAHLAGKALNTVAELSPRKVLRSDVLKQVLSHEPISGRHLYKDLFTFTPRCSHLWACNELPRLDETHPSLMRRFVVISMGPSLSDAEAAEAFEETIGQEAEGVVATIVRSFCDVMQRRRFILPGNSDLQVSRMQFGDDIASIFARFRLERHPGTRATTEELKRELRAFAGELGMDAEEVVHDGTMKRLAGLMRSMFRAERRMTNGRPFYEGVRLSTQPDHPDDDAGDLSRL